MDQHAILHIDMDAFFAAVEQRDNPALRGRPVLVGGRSHRGVVSTASYEARTFGCRSAMPMRQALRLCPQAIVVVPRMARYAAVSQQVFAILDQFTPRIEPLSIDEAFLDVTGSQRLLGPACAIASGIKRRIHAETGLTASVGVATSKFIAKLASDIEKPDGLVVVPAERVAEFLAPLPIARMWGVGPRTLPTIEQLGIRTFGDLLPWSEPELVQRFGEFGRRFFRLSRGLDDREVVPDRDARSMSHEVTFEYDVADPDVLRATLLDQIEHVAARLRRCERLARCVVLKVRTPDFDTITRRATLDEPADSTDVFWPVLRRLFGEWHADIRRPTSPAVRLLGAGVTQLVSRRERQLSLFDQARHHRRRRLDRALDAIRERYGDQSIVRGSVRGRSAPGE